MTGSDDIPSQSATSPAPRALAKAPTPKGHAFNVVKAHHQHKHCGFTAYWYQLENRAPGRRVCFSKWQLDYYKHDSAETGENLQKKFATDHQKNGLKLWYLRRELKQQHCSSRVQLRIHAAGTDHDMYDVAACIQTLHCCI